MNPETKLAIQIYVTAMIVCALILIATTKKAADENEYGIWTIIWGLAALVAFGGTMLEFLWFLWTW